MIWLGPAGVPTVSKDRSTLGGIRTVSELGLNAMEIEFVRRVYLNEKAAEEVGKLAKQLNVKLSVHAPYFLNVCSQKKATVEASKGFVLDSMDRAERMNADVVVAHIAYYSGLPKEKAFEIVEKEVKDIINKARDRKIKKVLLGLETTGKISQFGTVEEIVNLCKEVKGCVPVIDFAHLFARAGGKIDFKETLDKISVLKLKHLHTHFSGIEFKLTKGGGNEKRHLNIAEGALPDYKPLIKELLKRKIDITLISESPNLEQDALFLKNLLEEYGYKF